MENEIEILSSAANVNVKVLVSFFLCESSGSAATQAIHKERFNVPIDASHKDLHSFTKHVVAFTDLKQIPMAQSLCYLKGTGTVVVCCHDAQVQQS